MEKSPFLAARKKIGGWFGDLFNPELGPVGDGEKVGVLCSMARKGRGSLTSAE